MSLRLQSTCTARRTAAGNEAGQNHRAHLQDQASNRVLESACRIQLLRPHCCKVPGCTSWWFWWSRTWTWTWTWGYCSTALLMASLHANRSNGLDTQSCQRRRPDRCGHAQETGRSAYHSIPLQHQCSARLFQKTPMFEPDSTLVPTRLPG